MVIAASKGVITMLDKPRRLRKNELNRMFLDGLGDMIASHSGEESAPLLIDLYAPLSLKLRVYLFNCTNPPGGRALDEYKIQIILPGQKRGERGVVDYSEGRMPVLAAYVPEGEEGVFVIWDADKHEDFSYSANMQVKSDVIISALYTDIASITRKNNETILAVRPKYLYAAIKRRLEIRRLDILGGNS